MPAGVTQPLGSLFPRGSRCRVATVIPQGPQLPPGARLSTASGLPEAQGLGASAGWATLPDPMAYKGTGFPAVLPISLWQKMFSPGTGALALFGSRGPSSLPPYLIPATEHRIHLGHNLKRDTTDGMDRREKVRSGCDPWLPTQRCYLRKGGQFALTKRLPWSASSRAWA